MYDDETTQKLREHSTISWIKNSVAFYTKKTINSNVKYIGAETNVNNTNIVVEELFSETNELLSLQDRKMHAEVDKVKSQLR